MTHKKGWATSRWNRTGLSRQIHSRRDAACIRKSRARGFARLRCHSSVAMISRHAGMLRHCAGACVAAVGRVPLARGLTAASIATMPDGVAVVTLDQPRKRNALSMDLMQQTRSKLQAAASTPGVRVRGGCACGCGCVAMRYAAPSATDGLLVCPPAAGDCARSRGPSVQRWS